MRTPHWLQQSCADLYPLRFDQERDLPAQTFHLVPTADGKTPWCAQNFWIGLCILCVSLQKVVVVLGRVGGRWRVLANKNKINKKSNSSSSWVTNKQLPHSWYLLSWLYLLALSDLYSFWRHCHGVGTISNTHLIRLSPWVRSHFSRILHS